MPQLIPTQGDPNYTISCNLDGTDYQLTFRYCGRSNTFYLDLALTDGTSLVGGRKVVCFYPIWRIFRYNPQVPPGVLVAVASGPNDSPAGIDSNGNSDLAPGGRVQLMYFSKSELPLFPFTQPIVETLGSPSAGNVSSTTTLGPTPFEALWM